MYIFEKLPQGVPNFRHIMKEKCVICSELVYKPKSALIMLIILSSYKIIVDRKVQTLSFNLKLVY